MEKGKTHNTRMDAFQTKKSLGQHFLNNARVPEQMIEAAHILPTDTVLEIGPGTGALTHALLHTGARVVALEADLRAMTVLHERFHTEIREGRLTVMHIDVRSCDIRILEGILPSNYKVVANIPYYLSGMLFRFFLESDYQPKTIVFLVQKEVAHRIARDTKESLLSLSVKVYGDPHYIRTVTRGNFSPPPKVDSAIIAITDISKKRLSTCSESHFFRVLHAGFQSKRKQLLGNLTTIYRRTALEKTFASLSLSLHIRAEDVCLDHWIMLAKALSHLDDGV